MGLFDKIKNKNLQEKKKNDPGDALRKAIGKQSELDAAKDFQKDVGKNITPELKDTLNKKKDNLNRFFTDKPDSETLKTKPTGDEKQFKSKVKFDSGAKGKFPSGSPDLGGTQRKFVKDRRRKLDSEINKRRSAELTKSDAINRSMGGGPSTEGTGGANQGSTPLKKGKPFSKAESDAIQTRSLNKKTKQFVNKPGTTKSKGPGASTGGQKSLVVNPKSKGTTPVTVSTTKTVKQSEVSKKAKKFTTKINKANVNRKEFKFDPKTKERQTFRGKIISGPNKGQGYTIFRRDGGDVKKGVDKGVLPKAAKGGPIDAKSPAHKDLFKRYNKGQSKATQFMIDLGKDDRKARGLGKRAERVKDASGGKKTGSFSRGNLSLPGDRTGAYSRTKSEIEFNKALKKARGNTEGDLPKETPQSVRDYAKKVRGERIKKYKLPDTSFGAKDKFSQKEFEKSLKGASNIGTKQRIKSGKVSNITKKTTTNIPDPFKGATGVASPGSATKLKFQPKTAAALQAAHKVEKGIQSAKKSFSDFSKKLDSVTGRSRKSITKVYAPGTTGKVQMRPSSTNIPSGPKTPPKKYDIPADDRPGKLVQGRDFSSKKSYDAKLEKQVKILRGKADNLRKKQIKVAKTSPTKGTPEYKARSVSVKKIGARMKERTKAADALERSLKRQGTTGPTSMLPVVSGKGADAKMPGMGEKSKMTYKQFYKAANVGAYQPPKVKTPPKVETPPSVDPEDVVNKAKKSRVTSNYSGSFRNTSAFDKRVARMSRGFGGNRGKRAALGKVGRFIKNNKGKSALIALGAYAGYEGIKHLANKNKPKPMNAFRNSTYDKTVYHAKGPKAGKPVQYTYRAKNSSINPPGIGPASKAQTQRTLNKGIKSGEFKLK